MLESPVLRKATPKDLVLAPGARVVIRDAEWLVRRVDRTSSNGQAISCVGLSEIVRDKEAVFLSELEKDILVLKPEETRLVRDNSAGYTDSILYMESLLRQSTPTDDRVYIGHQGAMDVVPFQIDPTIQALKEPRQRILMADAVGLGKTIECGILLSELIKRGKGKRILVLAVKSMLTQFQKELWARFTIPLVRLDSSGIQRVRTHIPSNHNPFYYYDKSIISIDTLKQDKVYSEQIKNSYWDIIVIDEAHNVAERGSNSMRAKLAHLLSSRSDTLIMLSATPHDGKKRSFASLMNMLNPTAITNPDDYTKEDIDGLFIRRFKRHIKDQVAKSFKERKISRVYSEASPKEEAVFDYFTTIKFTQLDQRKSGGMLFKTTLEKALFSSPAACIDTISNRIKTLEKKNDSRSAGDIQQLSSLSEKLGDMVPKDFSKFMKLVETIKASGWTGKNTEDRLVIFTERIETLRFLKEYLPAELGLSSKAVVTLYGSLPDIDQNKIVEQFGIEKEPVRLLIASDVASEGINLHYLSHRLIHFDIPWSLMVFQQRNGRIDRYGQESEPLITYLLTQSDNPDIKGDLRILELLTEKDEQVQKNIGDASEFTGIYNSEEEEVRTGRAFENGVDPTEFENRIESKEPDPLSIIMGNTKVPVGENALLATSKMPSLFQSDYKYLVKGFDFIRRQQKLHFEQDVKNQVITLTVPPELERRLRFLPPEIKVHDDQIILCADRDRIQDEIAKCRKEDRKWPELQLLWELHPVSGWVNDKVIAAFRRHEAPVIHLPGSLKPQESIFIVSGLIPNRKGQPLINRWFGVKYRGKTFDENLELEDLMRMTNLGQNDIPNPAKELELDQLQDLLPDVVSSVRKLMTKEREVWEANNGHKLSEHLSRLKKLREKRHEQLELSLGEVTTRTKVSKRDIKKREIDMLFSDYQAWIRDTMTTEDKPFFRIVAVLWGGA